MIGYLIGFFFILLIVVAVLVITRAVVIVRPHERGVVERLGEYNRTMDPGLNFILPEIEKVRKVDIRERVIDIPPQEVITKDNASLVVDLVVYAQVIDPFKVLYNVTNFEEASIKLAQTNIRNIMGAMNLDEILGARERINLELRQILDDATDKWGVRVTRVEIQEISPPRDILEAMTKQMKAERIKRAVILEAEGMREFSVLKAEGEKKAAILKAEGEAAAIKNIADADKYSRISKAEAESQAVTNVFNAIHKAKPSKDIISLKYIEALGSMAAGPANKMFLPLETAGVLGSVAAIGEFFRGSKRVKEEKE